MIRRETELVGASVAVRERELALLRERQAILNTPGNVDDLINSHFADLVGREPQLPEFLRPANQGASRQ